jgi:coproporphyrinogen III oxidase
MENIIKKKLARNWFSLLQDIICLEVEKIEKKNSKFLVNRWNKNEKKDEGGGEYRILKDGKIFDKIGVNFSEVYGKFSNNFRGKIPGTSKSAKYWASGISIVMHLRNPHVPAMHFNTRYIQTEKEWFGGGMDFTPCFNDKLEKKWIHNELRKMCNSHNKKYYQKYKNWCDKYFYLNHRKETRGIGGIFFDYKKDNWNNDFKFVRDVGLTFQHIFKTVISKKANKNWSTKDKEKQFLKRGRYVEFNLLYDRGTRFGLDTGGNTEAILMSLPPLAKWK